MIGKHLFPLILHIWIVLHEVLSQTGSGACSQYFRNVHRRGSNVQGRLEIPTDDFFPKYKLRIGFSSPIHHMTIRQSRAKDTGTHREFVVDPMEMRKDGKLAIDLFIRLHRPFGGMSRMTRIIYNNIALCGDPVTASEMDESFIAETTSTSQPSTVPILAPFINSTTPSSKNKDDAEEEEDIWS